MRDVVLKALSSVNDPELGVNIVDLGLVYDVRIEANSVEVDMTMTAPSCPLSGWIAKEAEKAISHVLPGKEPTVRIVWTPKWTPERMSDAARAVLGIRRK